MPSVNPNSAVKKFVTENEIADGKTLSSERFVTLWDKVGTKKKAYVHGYGTRSREDANAGFSHGDLAATDSAGASTAPTGKFRLVIYESEDRERYKWVGNEYDMQDFRNSATSERSQKPVIPAQQVGCAEDEVLAIEAKVDTNYDGHTTDAANSDVHIPYGMFRVNQS